MHSKKAIAVGGAVLMIVSAWVTALGQADTLSGKYTGLAKSAAIGEFPITVVIKNENGKLTGSIDTPQGALSITGGTFSEGKLNLKFDAGGNEGTVTGQLKDDKITGEFSVAGQTGTVELKKDGAMDAKPAGEPAKKEEPKAASGADPISGEWDASADVGGSSLPFTLKLKLEGDKVSGEASSSQGNAPVSKGTWAGGKLSVTLDTPNGAITLTGTVAEGKITGDFDFAGQAQGKWEAKKK
jgi:hypothetical protein